MNNRDGPSDKTPSDGRGETDDKQNSLSRGHIAPQPSANSRTPNQQSASDSQPLADASPQPRRDNTPTAHVVLYQPEIPQNTGNIGRSCVAVGAKLWIVRPAGFRLDDARLRRAGLDYWQHLQLGDAANWDDLLEQLRPPRLFFLSRFAQRSIWEAQFEPGDAFVFGRETAGLPESILDPSDPRAVRLPTSSQVRSLNLATTVGIVLYEHQRQTQWRSP